MGEEGEGRHSLFRAEVTSSAATNPEVFFFLQPSPIFLLQHPRIDRIQTNNRSIIWISFIQSLDPLLPQTGRGGCDLPTRPVGSNHHATPTTTTMAPTEWDPLLPNGNRQTGRNYTGILTKTIVYGITLVLFLIGACFLSEL